MTKRNHNSDSWTCFLNTIHRTVIRSVGSWLLFKEEIERIMTTCSSIRTQGGHGDAASSESKDQNLRKYLL